MKCNIKAQNSKKKKYTTKLKTKKKKHLKKIL